MENRAKLREAFVASLGFDSAALTPLAADASSRQYFRLRTDEGPRLIMDAPPGAEAAACPPDADTDARRALGYNALARLAGPRMEAFAAISEFLRTGPIDAPKVERMDVANGFALIEDFGDDLLVRRIDAGDDEAALYRSALGILGNVRRLDLRDYRGEAWPLLTYDATALQAEADLFLEWFVPHLGGAVDDEAKADWRQTWLYLVSQLSAPSCLVLRDFHAENLIVTGNGLAVIDFQDALIGHPAYDVVSLLEDARRDVDAGLANELYAEDMRSQPAPQGYARDYAILAAQRNAKILGVFARLIHRDGKEKYRAFIPRVAGLFARDLTRDPVAPLRSWMEAHVPEMLKEART